MDHITSRQGFHDSRHQTARRQSVASSIRGVSRGCATLVGQTRAQWWIASISGFLCFLQRSPTGTGVRPPKGLRHGERSRFTQSKGARRGMALIPLTVPCLCFSCSHRPCPFVTLALSTPLRPPIFKYLESRASPHTKHVSQPHTRKHVSLLVRQVQFGTIWLHALRFRVRGVEHPVPTIRDCYNRRRGRRL